MSDSQILETYEKCRLRCLETYQKPSIHATSWEKLVQKMGIRLNLAQEEAVKLLFNWRDAYSRQEDESINFTLPNFQLLNLARELPKEEPGILACCTPIPPPVRECLKDILKLIERARLLLSKVRSDQITQKLVKASTRDTSLNSKVIVSQIAQDKHKFNYDDVIDCPHDARKPEHEAVIESNFREIDLLRKNRSKRQITKPKLFAEISSVAAPVLTQTPAQFITDINKNIRLIHPHLSATLNQFEWDFVEIDRSKYEKQADEVVKPAEPNLENAEIDLEKITVQQSKKMKKIAKREQFTDMAVASSNAEYKSKFTGIAGDNDSDDCELPMQVKLEEEDDETPAPAPKPKRKSQEPHNNQPKKKPKMAFLERAKKKVAAQLAQNTGEIDIQKNVDQIKLETSTEVRKQTEKDKKSEMVRTESKFKGKKGGRNKAKARGGKSGSRR